VDWHFGVLETGQKDLRVSALFFKMAADVHIFQAEFGKEIASFFVFALTRSKMHANRGQCTSNAIVSYFG